MSHAGGNGESDNVTVVIRVRPPLARELESPFAFRNVVDVSANKRTLTISDDVRAYEGSGAEADAALVHMTSSVASTHVFTFDRVYDERCSQDEV